jgi:hypothetical protein
LLTPSQILGEHFYQRPAAGLRLTIERKRYGQKNDWAKRGPVFFCPIIFLPQKRLTSETPNVRCAPGFLSIALLRAVDFYQYSVCDGRC